MRNISEEVKEAAIEEAHYIVNNSCTVRDAAKHFGVSKSKVHRDCTAILEEIANNEPKYKDLYRMTLSIMQHNKKEGHIRGGIATREKLLNTKNQREEFRR